MKISLKILHFYISFHGFLLFLKIYRRYLNFVLTKTLLSACSIRWKMNLKVALQIKSPKWNTLTDRHLGTKFYLYKYRFNYLLISDSQLESYSMCFFIQFIFIKFLFQFNFNEICVSEYFVNWFKFLYYLITIVSLLNENICMNSIDISNKYIFSAVVHLQFHFLGKYCKHVI